MDAMIDLETLSLAPSAVILQVAAVKFEPVFNGKVAIESPFDSPVRFATQPRHIDPRTLLWWTRQSDPVRRRVLEPALETTKDIHDLPNVLLLLDQWLKDNQIAHVWASPAAFDLGILRDAYATFGFDLPWSHRAERDTRTLWALVKPRGESVARRAGVYAPPGQIFAHDALYDAIMQALKVQDALR